MIVLDATTKSLEIVLGGAVTTNQLPFVSSYTDINQSTFALSGVTEQDGVSNDTSAVTVVTAPGATTSRALKYFSIENKDTVSATVTVRYNNNGTTRNLVVQALTAGQTLVYDEANGWSLACTSGGGGSLPDPVTVPHGGTGDTTLTNHGVLLGQGTSAVVATAAGTSGQPLLSGGAAADPAYGTLGLTFGGTDADLHATGGTSQVLKQVGVGSAVTVGQLAFTDLSDFTAVTAVPYASGNFTASAGTWTVDNPGDYFSFSYQIIGKVMTIWFDFEATSVSTTPNTLNLAIPASKTCALRTWGIYDAGDNGGASVSAIAFLASGASTIAFFKDMTGGVNNWSAATNSTLVRGTLTFPIN